MTKHPPHPVCFRCGYDVLGTAAATAPDRCPECGVKAPVSGRPLLPWPPWYELAWRMSRVGAYSAAVFCAVLVIETVASRSGWLQLANIAGWAAAGVVALGLLVSFVYAVTMPDVLLERHSARGHRDRNRRYLELVALGAAANALVIIMTIALIMMVSVGLKLLRI